LGGETGGEVAQNRWHERLAKVLTAAGCREIKHEGKTYKATSHCFRNTFAVDALNHGTPLTTVAAVLGHKNTEITEAYYLPFVKSRQQTVVDDVKAMWRRREAARENGRTAKGKARAVASVAKMSSETRQHGF
jgi:integrase